MATINQRSFIRIVPVEVILEHYDEFNGQVTSCLDKGEMTDDSLMTFTGYEMVKIPSLQILLAYIFENGFEHHTALKLSWCTAALNESFMIFLGWGVYFEI
jgi:hypothetical protein